MNRITIQQLVEAIAFILKMKRTPNFNDEVALCAMMLSDKLYEKLFQNLSQELNVEITILHKIFVEQIVMKQLLKNNDNNHVESQEGSGHKLIIAHMRKPSSNSQAVQNQFVVGLKQLLLDRGCSVNAFTNHRQLCVIINEHLKENRPKQFWKDLKQHIPQKTEVQLREYYQKSFLRHMYEESISVQDKIILCDLMNEMTGAKPSKIADEFVKIVGTGKYFYRNIIMYIVNKKEK
ncbi:Hypothetical_protein [Hexamita inflata]|uniref:Hypothetical_protein n=1 Tax=Hexamita inflata TaxID=28002 RepID=A0AA86NJS5_9EUKA|nr:Hypothetical protein HINF_LOCUS8278 [Hexamita inflata]